MNSPQTKSNHIRGQLHFTLIFTRVGLFSLVFCCPKPLTKQELIRLDCKTFHHWIILNKVVIGNGNWTKRTLMSLQFVCRISFVCYNCILTVYTSRSLLTICVVIIMTCLQLELLVWSLVYVQLGQRLFVWFWRYLTNELIWQKCQYTYHKASIYLGKLESVSGTNQL